MPDQSTEFDVALVLAEPDEDSLGALVDGIRAGAGAEVAAVASALGDSLGDATVASESDIRHTTNEATTVAAMRDDEATMRPFSRRRAALRGLAIVQPSSPAVEGPAVG